MSLKKAGAESSISSPVDRSIVIVGNGMVGSYLCEQIVEKSPVDECITVIGEESHPAYDRVHLSRYARTGNIEDIVLRSADWYHERNIDLRSGVRVVSINRKDQSVILSDGSTVAYDKLVLATGSRAFVPDVVGSDLPGVHVYRTIDDTDDIVEQAKTAQAAVVVGGGLLGLEAAELLAEKLVETTVVQLGDFLMSAQLNAEAADALQKEVEERNIKVRLNTATQKIVSKDGRLEVCFADESTLMVDMVVFAAGIVPNSEIAADAGLPCGVRGGVIVNDTLQSVDDEHIYAVGECALHRNQIYGLVGPGYEMARVLGANLTSKKAKKRFKGGDRSTRLKMAGTDVVSVGAPLDPKGKKIIYRDDSSYRLVAMGRGNRVVGFLSVGEWSDITSLQYIFEQGAKLNKKQLKTFTESGSIGGTQLDVAKWPDAQLICNCMSVSKGQLCAAMADGANTCAKLQEATGAGTVCGSCQSLVENLATGNPVVSAGKAKWLIAVSALALVLSIVAVAFTMPIPDSVESLLYTIDLLWRDTKIKQITGLVVTGLALIGLLMSLRKRVRWLKFLGQFRHWRFVHTVFGFLSLFALFAHTGFRFGSNLNFWLMFTFVGLNILGAFAGIVAGLERDSTSRSGLIARRLKPTLTYAHIVLFWPFPILLIFHIAKSYHW